MKLLYALAAGVLALGPVSTQAQSPKVEFEVASVRLADMTQRDAVTVGLRMDGAQMRIGGLPMRDVLAMAYRVRAYQISGPDWLSSERFDINAKLPAGATAEQVPDMLQSLMGRFEGRKFTAQAIALSLERWMDRPVLDLTELKGTYDLDFTVSPEDYQTLLIRAAVNAGVRLPPQALQLLDNGGNALPDAVEQLGLKMESRRMPVDVIVIDQMRKAPTDN